MKGRNKITEFWETEEWVNLFGIKMYSTVLEKLREFHNSDFRSPHFYSFKEIEFYEAYGKGQADFKIIEVKDHVMFWNYWSSA